MNVAITERVTATSAWQLEFARLIAFPEVPQVFVEQRWWQELASGLPDDFVLTRQKHSREERGSFEGVLLSLRIDVHRVEWLIQPAADSADQLGVLPTIGSFREKVDWFIDLMSPWLENACPPLMRLAFAGKLLQPAATQQEAYRVLAEHLPAVQLDPNPNDFLLQINRRRTSEVVPGLELNRMSSWSKLNATLSVESMTRTPFKWPDTCYSAVQLDINTAPERSENLPRESLPRLFRELALLGVEIAERGDIR